MKKWKIDIIDKDSGQVLGSNENEAPNPVLALRHAVNAHKICCARLPGLARKSTNMSYYVMEVKNAS